MSETGWVLYGLELVNETTGPSGESKPRMENGNETFDAPDDDMSRRVWLILWELPGHSP